MIDLMLTKTGDLMFVSEVRKQNIINLLFCISEANAIKLDFYIDESLPLASSPSQIKLDFDITSNSKTYTPKTVTKKDFAKQACLFRLKTQLGELKARKTTGSKIEEVKHDFLFNELVIAKAQTLAKEAVKDIYPNAKVTAEPYAKKTSLGYKQVMVIKIYDEDIMVLEYEVG